MVDRSARYSRVGSVGALRRSPARPPHTRRGAILLEVVLALALFTAGAGVVIGALSGSIRTVGELKTEARAADLAVSVMSQVQLGIIPATDAGPSPFDEETDLADWTWQIVTSPADGGWANTDLKRVEVVIHHGPSDYTRRLSELMVDPASAGTLPGTGPLPAGGEGGLP